MATQHRENTSPSWLCVVQCLARPTVWVAVGVGRTAILFRWLTELLLSYMHKLEHQSRSGRQPGEGAKGVFRCVNFDPTGLVLTLLPDMQTRRRTNPVSHITNDGASWDGGAALGIRGWSALAAIIGKTRGEGIRTEQGLLGRHHYLSESELLAFNGVKADC